MKRSLNSSFSKAFFALFLCIFLFFTSIFPPAYASEYPSYFTDMIEGFTFHDLETLGDEYHPYTAGIVAMDASTSKGELFNDMLGSFEGLTARVIALDAVGSRDTELAYLFCFPHRIWFVETDSYYGGFEITEFDPPVAFDSSVYVQSVLDLVAGRYEKYNIVDTELSWKYAVALYFQVTGQQLPTNENSDTHQLANGYMDEMAFVEPNLPTLIEKWPVVIDVAVDIPKDVTVEDAIFWLNHATSFPATIDYENWQIVGSFEAWEPGMYVVRLEAYLNGAPVHKEITLDGSAIALRPPKDEKTAYYDALNALPEGKNPLDDEYIYQMVVDRFRPYYPNPDSIAMFVRTSPAPFRDLFVWSLFDYSIVADKKDTYFSPRTNTVFFCYDESKSELNQLIVFFHEVGHAIDFNATGKAVYSATFDGREEIYQSMYNQIEAFVSSILDDECASKHINLTSAEKQELLDFILGHEYYDFKFLKFKFLPNQIPWGYTPLLPPSFSEAQKKAFMATYKQVNLPDVVGTEYNSNMYFDMLAGFTNQVLMTFGHGPVTSFKEDYTREPSDPKIYDPEYWYKADGSPTYYQNVEAWAEYFTSRLTEQNKVENYRLKDVFPLFDGMAEEMLILYKNKHAFPSVY